VPGEAAAAVVVAGRRTVARWGGNGERGARAGRERGGARGHVVACGADRQNRGHVSESEATHRETNAGEAYEATRTRTVVRTMVEAGGGGRAGGAEGEVGGAGRRGLFGLAAAARAGGRRLRADAVLGVRTAGVGRQGRGAVVAADGCGDGDGRREVRRRGGGGAGGRRLAASDRAGPLALPARGEDVPVVLDGVVGAPREEAGDERPPVAVCAVRRQEALLLLLRERPPVDPRVQLVEPPQPAALPCSIIPSEHASVRNTKQTRDGNAWFNRPHCIVLPDRPSSFSAMRFQFRGPCCATSSLSLASSAGRQWPLAQSFPCPLLPPWPRPVLTSSGSSTWPWYTSSGTAAGSCSTWNGDRAAAGGAQPEKQAISRTIWAQGLRGEIVREEAAIANGEERRRGKANARCCCCCKGRLALANIGGG
jgi:hypothetical protein